MKKRVTMKDVAKFANVSQTTVSRVLNGFTHIKPATRKRVNEAIFKLGFEPDEIARSLIKQKTNTIALIVDNISNPFFAETAKVIIDKGRKCDYDIIIYDTNGNNENFEDTFKILLGKRVAGILIGSISRLDQKSKELQDSGFPLVLFNRCTDFPNINSVTIDNEKGANLAVQHLVELGHRKIAFLSGPLKYSTFNERYLGYIKSLKKFGITYDRNVVYYGDYSHESIQQFVNGLLINKERPTAFFAATDQMAINVLDAVSRQNLKVPEDISIVGFDDINISANPYIGLTTVSQQKLKMASVALDRLIELIENEGVNKPEQIKLEAQLIVRKTTGSNI